MGHAIPLGAGLAAARPDQAVVACENDGGLIMNLGCLITAAGLNLPNLSIIVFDNGTYESSGGQAMPGRGIDYAAAARACGIENAGTVIDVASFGAMFRRYRAASATSLIHARTEARRTTPREVFDLHPAQISRQFAGFGEG
jgi:thiamine pyrophosphate-dependent acetolactate synthase large subunit-like protein